MLVGVKLEQRVRFGNDRKGNGKNKGNRRSFNFVPFGHFAQDDSIRLI